MIRLVIILVLFFPFYGLIAQEKLARQHFELAEQKAKNGDWDGAKDYLNRCLIANPTFAEGYAMRGEVNEKLSKPKEALTDYSIAIELLPDLTDSYLKRGVLAFSLDRFDLARSDFQKLLNIQNQETNMIYFRQSNNESFDKIFTLQSGIKDMIYNYLGLIETESENYDKAILYYDSAIHINPNTSDYYAHRGLAYLKQDRNDKATAEFEKALKLDPDHSISKNNLAAIRTKEGRLDEAEKYLREAKAVSQRTPDYFANLGILQYESGRYREAILNFDSAIAISSTEGDLYINRGLAKEKAGFLKSALQDYNIAIRIDSQWPKAWFVQGNYFMKHGEWEKALENYTVAITFDENYSLAYYNRAIVNHQLKQNEKACADLMTAEKKGMVIEEKIRSAFCHN